MTGRRRLLGGGRQDALRGLRVLVTGSDGARLDSLLRTRGAEPLLVPTIAIRMIDTTALDAALGRAWDWVVLTSANGVRVVAERLAARDSPRTGGLPCGGARWAAVGPRTANALRASGIEPSIAPPDGTGAAIAAALEPVEGRRVLLVRARRATADLPRLLRLRGAKVTELAVYETVEGPESSRAPLAEALERGIDAVIFTSGSTVRGLARLAGSPARVLGRAAIVAIGPTTAAAAREAGLDPREARGRSPESIVEALGSVYGARIDG